MAEYLELGSTPFGEDCAQVGSDNYQQQSSVELSIYRKQLIRMFPDSEHLLFVKSFPHDFGPYKELCIRYSNDREAEIAFNIEGNLPEYWDDEAKLSLHGPD